MSDQPSKAQKITGIALTAVPGLMLLMSAGMKLSGSPEVVEGFGLRRPAVIKSAFGL